MNSISLKRKELENGSNVDSENAENRTKRFKRDAAAVKSQFDIKVQIECEAIATHQCFNGCDNWFCITKNNDYVLEVESDFEYDSLKCMRCNNKLPSLDHLNDCRWCDGDICTSCAACCSRCQLYFCKDVCIKPCKCWFCLDRVGTEHETKLCTMDCDAVQVKKCKMCNSSACEIILEEWEAKEYMFEECNSCLSIICANCCCGDKIFNGNKCNDC